MAEDKSNTLPLSAQLDARVEHLIGMGFEAEMAERALRRANNDIDLAITMLTSGLVPEEDEFDLLANEAPKSKNTAEQPKFQKDKEPDHFVEGVPAGAPVSAILDSRIHQFIEMGFDATEAEQALKVANNDVDKALQLLSSPVDDLSA